MRRVLVAGGRVVVNAPGPESPLFGALAQCLKKHVGPQAVGFVHAVFSLHDVGEFEQLLTGSGLRDVAVEAETKTLPLPASREFLWQYITGTPLSPLMAETKPETRSALERDVAAGWKDFEENGGLSLRQRVVTASVRK